ncbi:MAG: hypothetical protein ACLS9A_09290, partial [Clostridia bacterium]
QIPIPFTMIASQLKDYRKRLVKEIQDKSKNFSIKLDENENEIISMKKKKDTETVRPKQVEEETKEEDLKEEDVESEQESSYIPNNNFAGNSHREWM